MMKSKIILLIIASLIGFLNLKGQDSTLIIDTSTAKGGKIMIVPFQLGQYFVNNDAFLCKGSNLNPKQLQELIRNSLADKMLGSVSQYNSTEAVSEQKEKAGQFSLVDRIYGSTIYRPIQKPLVARYEENPEKSASNLWGLANSNGAKGKNNFGGLLKGKNSKDKNHLYFQAVMKDTQLLSRFEKEYGVKSFLFINHFEMETHFKDCADIQKQVSQRDMYVHYTVLSSKGKFINGGVVCTSFKSPTNNIREILKSTLPSISNMILEEVKPLL